MLRAESDSGTNCISYHSLAAELVDRNHVQLSWIAGAAIIAIISVIPNPVLQPEAPRDRRQTVPHRVQDWGHPGEFVTFLRRPR
jgi:hypothetical protein